MLKNEDFVHLHVHTIFSKSDGAIRLDDLGKRLKSLGQTACAITDHGNMCGVPKFYEIMKKYGIKPILGYESYTAPYAEHLILLAKTNEGYKNLVKICTLENVDGFTKGGKFAKGALDLDEVLKRKLGKGVIATTACLGSSMRRFLIGYDDDKKNIHEQPNYQAALTFIKKLQGIFEEVYIELQDNTTKEQAYYNMQLLRLHKDTGLPIIMTKDAHYLEKEDWKAHDALLAKQVNKQLDDPNRWHFPGGPDYYIASTAEMEASIMANHYPIECLTNTVELADKCNVELFGEQGVYHGSLFPDYPKVPVGYTQDTYLIKLATEGLIDFFKTRPAGYRLDPQVYIDRLKYELGIITSTGYSGYFLILWDFLDYCRRAKIGMGLGRGSGVASLVARCLNITKVDPILYNLTFERFLNPERDSPPDVDVDVSSLERYRVIEYLQQTYGSNRVGQIITFTNFKLGGGTREMLRLKGLTKAEQDAIVKFIPDVMPDGKEADISTLVDLYMNPDNYKQTYGSEFDEAYKMAESFYNATSSHPWLYDIVSKLEHCVTSTGAHAGGVLIFPGPADDYAPMNSVLSSKSAVMNICQYNMKIIDKLKILKIDVLGLATTAKIANTCKRIGLDIDTIPYDDEKVFEMLRAGNTTEVFQFSSPGMTKMLIDMNVHNIEQLIAGISLYRPGPLNAIDSDTNDTIFNTYVKCAKSGEAKPCHPRIQKILEPTYGNIVYQEQVMQLVMEMGRCTYGYSDLLRRAMGKKDRNLMNKIRNEFKFGLRVYDKDENGDDVYNRENEYVLKPNGDKVLLGAVYNGFTEEECDKIFDAIVEFAAYCFNKSHATAYALSAYQTAYLKCHYPAEFLLECMTVNETEDSIFACIKEAKRMGIPILPIDINHSTSQYVLETLPDGRKGIRLGFSMIKGITNADIIVEQREHGDFTSIDDFFSRIGKAINRTKAPLLILAGAFDSLEPNRHKSYNYYFKTIRGENPISEKDYKKLEKDKAANKSVLSKCFCLKDEAGFADDVKYGYENDLIGLCVTGHPLDKYPYQPWSLVSFNQRTECYAIIKDLHVRQDKRQRAYAFFTAECLEDTRECVMWATDYAKHGNKLSNGKTLLLRGTKKADRTGNPQFVVAQAIARFNANDLNDKTVINDNGIVTPTVLEDPTATLYNRPRNIEEMIYPKTPEEDGITFNYC